MNTANGTDRLVLLAGDCAYKLPRIDVRGAAITLSNAYDTAGMKGVKHMLRLDAESFQSPRWFVGHGIVANRREERLAAQSTLTSFSEQGRLGMGYSIYSRKCCLSGQLKERMLLIYLLAV